MPSGPDTTTCTQKPRRRGRSVWLGVILVGGVAGLTVALRLNGPSDTASRPGPRNPSTARTPVTDTTVKTLCSQCHTYPDPSILPRSEWRTRIGQMATLKGYGSKIRGIVNTEEVVRWYEARAPETLTRPALDDQVTTRPPAFRVKHMETVEKTADPVVISNVQVVDLLGDKREGRNEILTTDMANGLILLGHATPAWTNEMDVLARVGHPARCHVVDLDGDGLRDLLVADLGSFGAIDHNLGKVTWLRQGPGRKFSSVDLATDLPRVSDVRPADFDGDGDLDLVVGAFGWRTTGKLLVLERTNRSGLPSPQGYIPHQIDQRHGTVHVAPLDLNNDGHLDFVSLIAQEHESVVAFLGSGSLSFKARTLFQAPHPCWGSSGIQLIDLDGDGDTDVLMTNGDTMDDAVLKPDHGIRWLENTGDSSPFVPHQLARLYGVHRAEAADIDNDGDLDVIACGFVGELKGTSRSVLLARLKVPSLMWIEQTAAGSFTPHTLESHLCNHPTLSLGDVDNDGDIDIAVGNNTSSASTSPVDIWINSTSDSK
ncbi:MAG TPA: hypothetical protein DIC23_12795 [Planctomycetaceae bacterium]|nr:hypothetical protein [Planctomycetaceae bacterium]